MDGVIAVVGLPDFRVGRLASYTRAEGPYSVARLIFPSAPVLIRASLAIRSVFEGLDH